jgi:hypothetical protein
MSQLQRWYLGYSYLGKPQNMIETISKNIQEKNLSKYLPLLRLEKGAKPRKQFYFFLAVESVQVGSIPAAVERSHLLKLPYFKKLAVPGNAAFTYEQIKPMVGTVHDIQDHTNPIPYYSSERNINDNPFNQIDSEPVENLSFEIESKSQRYDRLLYLLSAIGYGTWESFKKICYILNLEEPKRILRRLKLLGHFETSSDGKRWSVAPITLVQVNSNSDCPEFILCGQRSPDILDKLKQYAEVISDPQPRANAPNRIRIKTKRQEEIIRQLPLLDAGQVSLKLAAILPDITVWQKNLIGLPGIVTSLYNWKKFNIEINSFVDCIHPKETGMYQMFYAEKTGIPPRTLFYEAETQTWRQADWYGLRFLVHYHSDHSCLVHYDPQNSCLTIPWNERWPEVYERALVLASGYLPTYQKTQQAGWLTYENIGNNLLQRLIEKLRIAC